MSYNDFSVNLYSSSYCQHSTHNLSRIIFLSRIILGCLCLAAVSTYSVMICILAILFLLLICVDRWLHNSFSFVVVL